jgi:hypothetical protein
MKLSNYGDLSRVAGMLEGMTLGVSEEFESIIVDAREMIDAILKTEEVELD